METKSLDKKLLLFQIEIETIKKDGQNTFFKKPNGKASTYATLPRILSEVKPLLNKLGCLLTQPIIDNTVFTRVKDVESGEFIESGLVLPANLNAQQMGSNITYFRRQTINSLLALEIEEDDDGNEASKAIPVASKPLYLNKGTEAFDKAVVSLQSGKVTMEQIEKKYTIAPPVKSELINLSKIAL